MTEDSRLATIKRQLDADPENVGLARHYNATLERLLGVRQRIEVIPIQSLHAEEGLPWDLYGLAIYRRYDQFVPVPLQISAWARKLEGPSGYKPVRTDPPCFIIPSDTVRTIIKVPWPFTHEENGRIQSEPYEISFSWKVVD